MKKEIKVVAIVLVALIVFLSGFGLGASQGITIKLEGNLQMDGAAGAVNTGATQTPPTTTAAPQVDNTTTTAAPSGDTTTTAAPSGDTTTTAAPSGDAGSAKVPSTPAEVVAAYNKAINEAKNYTGAVHLKKDSVIAIQITDCPGGDLVKGIVQPIVDNFAGTTTTEWDFNNGQDADGGKIFNRITPGDREAKLTEADVASATATADGDGYKLSIKIVGEKSTFDGTNTTYPVHHQSIMDPLNLATLDVNPITITAADMDYPGATVDVTVDGQGRLTSLAVKMPLDGSGTGSVKFPPINATIGLAGSLDDTYTLTY